MGGGSGTGGAGRAWTTGCSPTRTSGGGDSGCRRPCFCKEIRASVLVVGMVIVIVIIVIVTGCIEVGVSNDDGGVEGNAGRGHVSVNARCS